MSCKNHESEYLGFGGKDLNLNPNIFVATLFFIPYTLPIFLDFNCPVGKQATKKTIKIGAGESVMYNTNPGGADK